jgi:phospholipase A1
MMPQFNAKISAAAIKLWLILVATYVTAVSAEEILDKRIEAERQSHDNPFIITQHRANYILPYTYSTDPSQENYTFFGDEPMDNAEAKYQLSIKAPLYSADDESLEGLYFAFTLKSWWQVYNSDISAPFRETNYEPELFYLWAPSYELGGLDIVGLQLGANHQSNGRTNPLSRSWNRIVGTVIAETENFYYVTKVWYRLPEDEKDDPANPVGDDNPDILDYMGNFEFTVGTRVKDLELSLMLRNNLSTSNNRAYYELNAAYPLTKRFDLLLQYANGYGESLIDYDYKIERFGIGIQFARF